MDAIVRLAREADIPSLVVMRREFTFEDTEVSATERPDYEHAMNTLLSKGFADGSWVVFVAEADGKLLSHVFVGLIEKVPRPTPGFRYIGYLTNVYTRPAFRNRGIGGRVFTEVQSWAHEAGVELLFVWPSDESADFYQRHDFKHPPDLLVWEPEQRPLLG